MSKVFLITGARKGIGRELCEYYLNKNFTVIGCSRQKSDLINNNYKHYEVDISDERQVLNMIKDVRSTVGRIDVLINNAGIASMNHIITTDYKSVQGIFATNFFGAFLLTREASKLMIKQKFGRIVNISTIAVPLKLEGEAIYVASKAALESFTQVLAKELAPYGITANAIGPTPIPTDLIKTIPKEKIDGLIQNQAIKRFATIEDITNVIDFFISEKSSFITGQIIYLGGISK